MVDKTGTGAPERIVGSALSDSLVCLGGDETLLKFAGHNIAEDAAGEDTPTGSERTNVFVLSPQSGALDANFIFKGLLNGDTDRRFRSKHAEWFER